MNEFGFWNEWVTDPAMLEQLNQGSSILYLKAGDLLFRQGDEIDSLLFLVEGLFRGFYTLENGEEKTESIKFQKGQLLGSLRNQNIADRKQNTNGHLLTMEALTDSICLRLPLLKVMELQKTYMDGKRLYARLLQEEGKEWWKSKAVRDLYSASERWKWFRDHYGPLIGKMKKKDIASFLNLTPVMLSRIITKTTLDEEGECKKKD